MPLAELHIRWHGCLMLQSGEAWSAMERGVNIVCTASQPCESKELKQSAVQTSNPALMLTVVMFQVDTGEG